MPPKSNVVREPIATLWKIYEYKVGISPLRVVAFTPAFVTYIHEEWAFSGPGRIVERRERRDNIFPSFAEAKAEAVKRAKEQVESAEAQLRQNRSALGQWESLREPE
jgi:hypothetical protein